SYPCHPASLSRPGAWRDRLAPVRGRVVASWPRLGYHCGMRIGYVTPNSWGLESPDAVVRLAVEAEERGAHSLWVSHHVLHVGFVGERLQGGRPYHDPLVMLTLFSAATSTARLGTSVLVLPYLHPVPLAKALATIDHASHGRLDVGIGVGGLQA